MAAIYIYAAIVAAIMHGIYRIYTDPLQKFAGPHPARWTNLWKVLDTVTTGHKKPTLIELHQRHGDVVRIGPNTLRFAHPQAVKDIYGADKPFNKSDYYSVAAAVAKGRPNPFLFSSLDSTWHDRLRRAIQPSFNLTALVSYEPFVDNTITTFIGQLERRFVDKTGVGGIVELAHWFHWYAFDVIGELTYGSPIGFLESGSDVERIIGETHRFLIYAQVIGGAPWLDLLLLKNPILLWFNRRGLFNFKPNPAVPWALSRQNARINKSKEGDKKPAFGERTDLLDKFLQAKEKHLDTITDKEVLGMGLSMVFAGSETTATTLTAVFYFLLKHSYTYQKLRSELDSSLSKYKRCTPIPLQAAQKLSYLDACVKETFRLHPAARFSSERVVPQAGATIAGYDINGGTVVGINAWVLHCRRDIFGEDVESYRPEQWLPTPDIDSESEKARITTTNRCLF